MSEGRLASVPFGPLQLSSDVFVLAVFVSQRLVHNHVRNAKLRRLFFLGKLHALHVFDVTNNIWASRINDGRLNIIDNGVLIKGPLISSCCLRLRLLLLLLLLHLHELLEGAFEFNLAFLPLLRHGLGALLQQVDCSSLLLCTQVKRILAY